MPALLSSFTSFPPDLTGAFAWLGVVLNAGGQPDTNFSFTSVSFGDEHTNRLVVVNVHWIFAETNRTLSSATIGGVSATINAQDSHTGGSTGLGAAIISAAVPTGTTGTIALTFSGIVIDLDISVFRAKNLASNTPYDTMIVQGFNDTDISGTINVPASGAVLIAGTGSTNTNGNGVAITGAAEVYDGDFSGTRAGALSTGLSLESNRACHYNMGTIPDSGTEMVACSWQLN